MVRHVAVRRAGLKPELQGVPLLASGALFAKEGGAVWGFAGFSANPQTKTQLCSRRACLR